MDRTLKEWNDPKFLLKRLDEQFAYENDLRNKIINRELPLERFKELYNSSDFQTRRIKDRLLELALGYENNSKVPKKVHGNRTPVTIPVSKIYVPHDESTHSLEE